MNRCIHLFGNRIAAFVISALLIVKISFASNGGKIAGKISDKANEEPLIGAHVVIDNSKMGAATDPNGEYFILNVAPGKYTLVVSMLGYETLRITDVTVDLDRTTNISVALKSTTLETDVVEIVGQRPIVDKDLTASEQIVTSAVIERSGAKSINEVLSTQTGYFNDNSSFAWQRGLTRSYVRGSSNVQEVYTIDGLSVNSGLVSDNYSGFNTSTIQEVSVLTGGYNAEYGEGRSAVVNIISKEPTAGIHGTILTRVRPPGVYHFGPNMYDQSNSDYVGTGIDYWKALSLDPNSQYYRARPDSLLATWRKQSTPNDTLANYANRAQYEYEGTLMGEVTEDLGFLVSGRFKRGVGIFPEVIPYNPEYNVQGYITYKLLPDIKLRIGGFIGGYESADYTSTNMNTSEYGQESAWLAPMRIDEQFARAKYNLYGAAFRQWPELRHWAQLYGKMTHILNAHSFYEVTVSYLKDRLDRSDRNNVLPDSLWLPDVISMVPRYTLQQYYHTWTRSLSQTYQIRSDYTNQITPVHSLKSGLEFNMYDLNYSNYAAASGQTRINDMNIYNGHPYEGDVYLQDKIETPGLIVNVGVRGDFFNQNRDAPKDMFDPLAFEVATPGHDPRAPLGIPGTPETVRTKLQVAVAPRIGISHPLSDDCVLHFQYGHFFQRPSWSKMFGFPFVNYTTIPDSMLNPYAKQTTFMDEWQGYYGNPDLGYERTIQYELGVDYDIANILKLNLTGYYKDASHEADVITGVYAATYVTTKALMVSNGGYSDVRGIDTKLSSRFRGIFNFGLSHEVYWSFSGEVGFNRLYEPGSTNVNSPKGNTEDRGPWANYHRVKGWVDFSFKEGEGPEFFGVHPLSDVDIYSYFWWRSGDPFTYHAPGDLSTEPNNMTWFNYYQIDLRVAKGFTIGGIRTELSVDIKNVFNLKFLRLLSGDDLTRYMQNPSLPLSERLPKTFDFSTPDVWEWYSYEVPPRQMSFQLQMTF